MINSVLLFLVIIIPCFSQPCLGNVKQDHFDVVIVLGSYTTNDCKPAPIMRERVNKGVELFKNGVASNIIVTGGANGNKCIEADVMAEYAVSLGVPDSAIIREIHAKNTYQNAYYSVEQMEKRNLKSAIIVSSNFHILRSCNVFSNYSILYSMSSVESPKDISKIKYYFWVLREKVILAYHTIWGYDKHFGLQ